MTPHCMFSLANDWAMISCHYIDVISHYSDLIFCICWVYRWLYSFFSFFKGQCPKSTNCGWHFKRVLLLGMLLKANAFLWRLAVFGNVLMTQSKGYNNCVLGVFEIFFSSMSCQNLKSRLRCMKVQADLVWD